MKSSVNTQRFYSRIVATPKKQIPFNGNDKNITKYYEKPIMWYQTVGHGICSVT